MMKLTLLMVVGLGMFILGSRRMGKRSAELQKKLDLAEREVVRLREEHAEANQLGSDRWTVFCDEMDQVKRYTEILARHINELHHHTDKLYETKSSKHEQDKFCEVIKDAVMEVVGDEFGRLREKVDFLSEHAEEADERAKELEINHEHARRELLEALEKKVQQQDCALERLGEKIVTLHKDICNLSIAKTPKSKVQGKQQKFFVSTEQVERFYGAKYKGLVGPIMMLKDGYSNKCKWVAYDKKGRPVPHVAPRNDDEAARLAAMLIQ